VVEAVYGSPGALGERIAGDYLQLAGCRILERNFRRAHVEVDLIVEDGGCVAFVEVKMRRGASFGSALEAVGRDKMRHLRQAARLFLADPPVPLRGRDLRFDLVALDLDTAGGTMTLTHLKGIA
jgi:putative endonuclease